MDLLSRVRQRFGIENYLTSICLAKQNFRSLLKKTPEIAIAKEMDLILPHEIEIEILPETKDQLCIVFPYMPPVEEQNYELDEVDLRFVNGGAGDIDLLDLLVNRLNGTLSKFLPNSSSAE